MCAWMVRCECQWKYVGGGVMTRGQVGMIVYRGDARTQTRTRYDTMIRTDTAHTSISRARLEGFSVFTGKPCLHPNPESECHTSWHAHAHAHDSEPTVPDAIAIPIPPLIPIPIPVPSSSSQSFRCMQDTTTDIHPSIHSSITVTRVIHVRSSLRSGSGDHRVSCETMTKPHKTALTVLMSSAQHEPGGRGETGSMSSSIGDVT
ncbi:hypothetical protein K439DRAFT_372269 [Ramaria rubella]|nr:hypothetical protein K439DRAFT_372269 [Ramaria rubella]